MQSTALPAPARCRTTAARLLDAPLDELLLELDVELHLSKITNPGFTGAVVQRSDGSLVLSMPPGRPALERDTVARAMLGYAIGIPLGPLPEPYRMTEL